MQTACGLPAKRFSLASENALCKGNLVAFVARQNRFYAVVPSRVWPGGHLLFLFRQET